MPVFLTGTFISITLMVPSTRIKSEILALIFLETGLKRATPFSSSPGQPENLWRVLSQREIDFGRQSVHTCLRLIDEFHFTYEEWQGGKIKSFTIPPFFVVPPWEDNQENSGGIKMVLDPGVVFGTTLHPTTRDSLTALATIYERHRIDQVLDPGTGTGILALGAALLGAQSVLAVDINPLAVRTAIANVRLNGLEERVEVKEGPAENWINHHADLVVANIHYDSISGLIKHKEFPNKKWFILSGLMRGQADKIRAALSQHHTEIIQEWNHEMIWHTFLGRGKGSHDE